MRGGKARDCGLGPQAASVPRCVATAPAPGSAHALKCRAEEPANQGRGLRHARKPVHFTACKLRPQLKRTAEKEDALRGKTLSYYLHSRGVPRSRAKGPGDTPTSRSPCPAWARPVVPPASPVFTNKRKEVLREAENSIWPGARRSLRQKGAVTPPPGRPGQETTHLWCTAGRRRPWPPAKPVPAGPERARSPGRRGGGSAHPPVC